MDWVNWLCLAIIFCLSLIAFDSKMNTAVNNTKLSRILQTAFDKISTSQYNYIILLLMIIATGVRLWKFGIIPAGFNQDGAMGAVDALALTHHGTDRFGMQLPAHFTAWGFGQMSVLLSYLSVPFIAVLGLNRFSARIAVLIISLLAVWIIYKLSKLVFGKGPAIAILGLCAINPWQIMQSRWALDCNMLPHFVLFGTYFLCKALSLDKKGLNLSIAMIFYGLSMYAYGIAWFTIPLFLMFTAIYFIITKAVSPEDIVQSASVFILVSLPILGVMLVNTFKFHTIKIFSFTVPYFESTTRASDLIFFSKNIPAQLKGNFEIFMNRVFLQSSDLSWNAIPQYGSIYMFAMPFFLIGLAKFIKLIVFDKDRIIKMPILIWFGTSILAGLIINGVNINRINIIFYPIIMLSGLGVYTLIKNVKINLVVVLLMFVIAFGGFTSSYFGEHSKVLAQAFFDGFGEALEYVKDIDYERVYVTNWTQGENSPRVSEPLTLFHHQIDALYFQGKADAYSKTGVKLLPYKERYKYTDYKNFSINLSEKAVYIVRNNELGLFDKSQFIITKFADFSALVPK